MNNEEQEYLHLLREVLYQGAEKDNRTGIGCKSVWCRSLRFDLSKGFPLITTRQVGFRIGFEEMMFFLRGETDTKKLEERNINIWKGNTSREFLDSRGLSHLPVGDMGRGYGHQIRNFGGTDDKKGFDQLEYLIENIKASPGDRRHLMSYWNPQQVLHEAALPCCHFVYGAQVLNGKLNSVFTMRSSDLYHGLPTNLIGYGLLSHIVAKLTGYEAGELVWMGYDAHLYQTQYEAVDEQIKRAPKSFPKLVFKKDFKTLDEALQLGFEDVEIVGDEHCGKLRKIEMAV